MLTETITNFECKSRVGANVAQDVIESTLCTLAPFGQGICFGDSGGPLAAFGILHGVASFTVGRCGDGYPDGWTRVAFYRPWILNVISNF